MSRTIDERVVTLRFDNAEFERNVKTSMSSLNKLEQSLKFKDADEGFKRVNDAAEKTDLNPLIKAQVTVTEGFSALEKVAINVLSSIAIRAEQAGERLVHALTMEQVGEGWNKYNQKIESVQTLVNSTGKSIDEINGYLDKLMWFSDETSYGFTDMTKSLAQLTSSGGKVENLMPMIMGIANATAFAGKSTQEFSRAIYNLNQSYGAGSLKYMDWKSLELAGVASKDLKQSFIETAIELGRLNEFGKTSKGTLVELGNFGETLKEGWADTSVMEATFGKFYQYTEKAYKMIQEGQAENASDAYAKLSKIYDDIYIKAARSAQEAKTFGEAIAATKDAVSTKWLKSFDLIFGNYDVAKETWTNLANDLWDIFASGGDIRNDVLSSAFTDDYTQLRSLFTRAGADFEGFNSEFEKYLEDAGFDVKALIKEYGSLSNAIGHNADIMQIESEQYNNLGGVLKRYISFTKLNLSEYVSSTKDVEKVTEHLQSLFDNVWLGTYGNGLERVNKLKEANIDYATTQELINKLAKEGHRAGYKLLAEDIEHLTDAELKNMGITREQAYVLSEALNEVSEESAEAQKDLEKLLTKMGRRSGQNLLSKTIGNITGSLIALQEAAREAWAEVFADVDFGDILYGVLEKIEGFTAKIKETIQESTFLRGVLEVVFSALKILGKGFSLVKEVIGQIIEGGLKVLSRLFGDLEIDIGDFADGIGNALDKALEWMQTNQPIVSLIEQATDGIAKVFANIDKWVKSIQGTKEVSETLSGMQTTLSGFMGKDFGITSIKNAYSGLVEEIEKNPADPFKVIGDNIGKFFGNFGSRFVQFSESIKTGFDKTVESMKMSEDDIAKFTDTFGKVLEMMLGIGTGAVFMSIGTKFANALESLASPFKSMGQLINSVRGTFNSITGYFTAKKANIWVDNIVKISIAVGILAAALYALSVVGKSNDVWNAILQIGALMVVIGGFALISAVLSTINEGAAKKAQVNMLHLAAVIGTIAVSIWIISDAIQKLDGMEHVWRSFFVIVGLMAALIAAFSLVRKPAGTVTAILDMVGIALAIKMLVNALSDLDNIEFKNPASIFWGFVGIIGAMVAVSWALKGVNKTSSLVLIAMSASLNWIVEILDKVASMDSAKYWTGLARLAPILVAMIGIIYLLGKVPEKSIIGAATYLVGTAIAVGMIAGSIEKLGKIKTDQLIKGGVAAVVLFAVIGAIGAGISRLAMVDKASIRSAVGSAIVIVTLAASLYLIAGAIMIFKNLDKDGLWRAVRVVSAVLGTIGVVMFLIGKSGMFAQGAQAYAAVSALTKIALIIGVLAVSLAALSFIPTKQLVVAGASLFLVIGSLALLTAMAKGFDAKAVLATFASMTIILAAVTAALIILVNIPNIDKALAVAEALSLVLVALGAAFLLGGVAANLISSVKIIEGLGPILIKIVAVIAVLAAVIEAIDYFFPGSTDALLAGLEKLGAIIIKIGEIAGLLVGETLGAILTGFSDQLAVAGENLSKFATAIDSFVNLVVPESFDHTLSSIVSLFKDLAPQYSNIMKLASLAGNTNLLSTFFNGFGAAMAVLSNKMDDVDTKKIQAAADAGTMFVKLNDSLGSDNLTSFFLGKQTFVGFKENLLKFGDGLVAFSTKMLDFKNGYVLSALPTIERLINLEGTLQNSWSLLGWLAGGDNGNKSLGDFGTRAQEFGAGLADFSTSLKNFDPSVVGIAEDAAKTLTTLESGLVSSWNVAGWLGIGDNSNQSLGDFGSRVAAFADGLVEGLNALAELGTVVEQTKPDGFVGPMQSTTLFDKASENIDWLVEVGGKLAGLETSLGDSASLVGATSNLTAFGTGIGQLSLGISDFANNFPQSVPNPDSVDDAIDILQKIVDFSNTSGLTSETGTMVGSLGTGIVNMVAAAKDAINMLFAEDGTTDEEGNSVGGGLLSSISEKIIGMFSNEELIEQIKAGAIEVGVAYLTTLADVFTDSDATKKLNKQAGITATNLVNQFKETSHEGHKMTYQGIFTNIGKNYIQGLIDGMTEMEGLLYDKARSIADNIAGIFASVWQEHSPSRVAFRMGSFFTQGLAEGIDDLSGMAVDNAWNMATSVRNAVIDAMVISDQMLENSLDPVISPVLDTANVINGANMISGLLSSGAYYNAAMSVEGVRNSSLLDSQNGGTKGALISMNNTFEINTANDINDPAVIEDMARKLYNRINILLGNSI